MDPPALSPARLFLILGALFGLANGIATPPFASPDEQKHLVRAYLISEGRLGVPGRSFGARYTVPQSFRKLRSSLDQPEAPKSPKRFALEHYRKVIAQPLEPQYRQIALSVAVYSPVAYLPQSLGVLVGRLLDLPPAALVYLGRAGNLLLWLAVGAWVISTVPLRKWMWFVWFLLPMAVFQAASLSADVPTHAIAAALVASTCRVAYREGGPATLRERMLLFGLALLIGLAKPGYSFMAAIVILLPAQRFARPSGRWVYAAAAVALAVVPALLWMEFVSSADPLPARHRADPAGQLGFLVAHPFAFAGVAAHSLLEDGIEYVKSLVGVLGLYNIWLPAWVYFVACATLVVASAADGNDPPTHTVGARGWLLALGLANVLVVLLACYVWWSPVGAEKVAAVQGRYFLPMLPMLLMALPTRAPPWPPRNQDSLVALAVTLCCTAGLLAIVGSYYSVG